MRDALVVGICTYQNLRSLKTPANDAEAIAQRLEQFGDFRVRRIPEYLDPFEDDARRVARNAEVSIEELEEALVQLFKPTGKNVPETALFFFSGHGLRKDRGIQEGYLATSDVNPAIGNWGLSLQWLRRLLQDSPIRQQVVWLDCCYSGELLNFDEADPGDRGRGRDRCFIAASREYEVAFEEASGRHSVLSGVLLEALDPQKRSDGLITNFVLTDFIQRSPTLKAATQQPLYANSGSKIILLGSGVDSQKPVLSGVCPYRGLTYFDCNSEDPKYFHGRTALTDSLLEKVREGNFLAILGASGSGKSSVLRAGLLHQLKLGQRLSGSDRWNIRIIRPGEHPLENLGLSFLNPNLSDIDRAAQLAKIEDLLNTGAIGLTKIAKASKTRLVLVIDQFEEVFTVCRDRVERQQFIECLLGTLEQAKQQVCIILAMRADFLSKCLEQDYAGLASKIQSHLVTVSPMNQEELKQAIVEPAKQVGLEVEPELVTQMLTDVESSPGSLPLLQYTLTELWKQRSVNWLTLATYNQLGSVRGTLQKRADEVYATLSNEEQAIAKQIFLALTQLGEGTEDTRRQVAKQDLINHSTQAELVDRVIEKLSSERLIVTSQLVAKGQGSDRVDVVDVAHEALIRHWSKLRQWIDENRLLLRQKRDLEAAAEVWRERGKPLDVAYLLQGRKLLEAEDFLKNPNNPISLSSSAQELIRSSQTARRNTRFRLGGIAATIAIALLGSGAFAWQQWNNRRFAEIIRDASINRARPELLPIADQLRQEGDRLANSGNSGDINDALNNYRVVINFTTLLQAENPQEIDIDRVKTIASETESSLIKLIVEHRLPQLEAQLRNQQFGDRKQTYKLTDYENRYTEGALQTTYALLLRELGVKADLNDDGAINSKEEADRIPCDLLKAIEELWRKQTGDRCGWYNKADNSAYFDPDCEPLQGNTLTSRIFEIPFDAAIDRLNVCQIAPKPIPLEEAIALLQNIF